MKLGIAALIAGYLLDLLLGDPEWLYHPVRLIGKYISFAEKRLRERGGNLRISALILTVSTTLLTMAAAALILWLLKLGGDVPLFIGMALMDWMGIAVTCMAKEARGVGKALKLGVGPARKQVARIVGRDTEGLNEEEIIKATVETVAENTTDGVISPILYALIGGPVLMWGYKAVNTLDSIPADGSCRAADRPGCEKRPAHRPQGSRQSQEPQQCLERSRGGGRPAYSAGRNASLLRQTGGEADDRR